MLALFLRAAPDAANGEQVKRKIYALEAAAQLAAERRVAGSGQAMDNVSITRAPPEEACRALTGTWAEHYDGLNQCVDNSCSIVFGPFGVKTPAPPLGGVERRKRVSLSPEATSLIRKGWHIGRRPKPAQRSSTS